MESVATAAGMPLSVARKRDSSPPSAASRVALICGRWGSQCPLYKPAGRAATRCERAIRPRDHWEQRRRVAHFVHSCSMRVKLCGLHTIIAGEPSPHCACQLLPCALWKGSE